MAVLPKVTDPGFPDVYELAVTDPVAGGPDGVDNLPHKQLAERTDHVKARVEVVEGALTGVNTRLESVEASAGSGIGRAVPISWDLDDKGFDFELFTLGLKWRDHAGVAVTGTVAGDDSIDVASTAGLIVGQTYVLTTVGEPPRPVTIAEILSGTRLTLTAAFPVTLTGGQLARTNWQINAGHAIAADQGYLYSRVLAAVRHYDDGRVVIRRDAGDGVLSVGWRKAGLTAWAAGTLLSSTEVETGTRDETWLVGGGRIEVRVTSAHGPSGADIRVEHMVLHVGPRAGLAEIVATPNVVSPAAGAANITSATPTLTASDYKSLYGRAHVSTQWQVGSDEDFLTLVADRTVNAGAGVVLTEVMLTSGTLALNRIYHLRVRYKDIDGVWSGWSPRRSFSTGEVFHYVAKPVAVAPASGATNVAVRPMFQASAFALGAGTDTHASSQWQISTAANFATVVADSGDSSTAKTSWTPTSDLTALGQYYWRARHKGAVIGWSDWSTVVAFTVQAVPGLPVALSPGSAGYQSITPNMTSSPWYVPGASDTHVGSQWQIAADSGFASVVHDSGETVSLTSYTVPSLVLDYDQTYYWRVRHRGAVIGWSGWSVANAFVTDIPRGEAVFTTPGIHYFVVPPAVYSYCGVVIGAGGTSSTTTPRRAGSGGGLRWANDVPCVPGTTIPITIPNPVTGGSTSIGGAFASVSGGQGGGSGGAGGLYSGVGNAGGGGGGAGGYLGAGGAGASAIQGQPDVDPTAGAGGGAGGGWHMAGGGGTGLYGIGASGEAGTYVSRGGKGGSGGTAGADRYTGGTYGGGASAGSGTQPNYGAGGAARIIWGRGRSFPYSAG